MRWLRIALWPLLAVGLMGQATPTATPTVVPGAPPSCAINGVVVNPDGSPFVNGTINFNSKTVQIISGVPVYPTIVNTNTDALGNIAAVLLPQGVFMQITMCAKAGSCSAPFSAIVPNSATSPFGNMITGTYLAQPIPNGTTNQIFGVNNGNVPEWETVGGDGTFTRTGANAYSLAVTKTNGVAFGALATASTVSDAQLANAYSGIGACTGGQLVSGLNRNAAPTCIAAPSGFTAGGDLSGTSTTQTVVGIRSTSIPVLATGYLYYNGSTFAWQTPSAGTGTVTSITAGTGLTGGTISTSGTIALATPVSTTNGGLGLSVFPTVGQLLIAQGTANFNAYSMSGDATLSTVSPGVITVTKTNGVAFGPLATASTVSDAQLANAYSGVGTCTGGQFVSTLNRNAAPTCTTPAGGAFTAGGDLSGTSSSQTVIGIRSTSVPVLSSGYLHYNGSSFVWDTPSGGGGISDAPSDGTYYGRYNATWANVLPVANPTYTGMMTGPQLTLTNNTTTQIFLGSSTTPGGAIVTVGSDNFNFAAGAHYNAGWIADATAAQTAYLGTPNGFTFATATGLTVGNTFTPTNDAYINATGINLLVGNYQFNGTNIGGTCGGGQYVSAMSGTGVLTCGTPAGGSGYPNGAPPQIGGYSATNTAEAETLSGDATLTRAGANSYTIAVTKTNGTAFTTAATTAIGTSGATIPLLSTANTWGAAQTFPLAGIIEQGSSTGVLTITNSLAGASNFTATFPPATGTVALTNLVQTWAANQTFTNSTLLLKGSSTGTTTFTSANASATSYTLTIPANTGTIAELNLAQTWTATQSLSGAGLTAATVATGALATVQGNGTKVQLSTGTTTTNDCVKFDANGNTVDNGSACGGGAASVTAWTPALQLGGGSVGMTYVHQTGYYTQNGKQITAYWDIDLSAKGTSTGSAQICGLPVASYTSAGVQGPWLVNNQFGMTGLTGILVAEMTGNQTCLLIYQQPSSGASASQVFDTSFTNTSYLIGTVTYLTN